MRRAKAIRGALSASIVLILAAAPVVLAQDNYDTSAPPVAPAPTDTTMLNDSQMQNLLAPIALYPDPLIAQILPASTYPVQVVDAARWLQANPNPSEDAIDGQNFEPSIEALLHYPSVLQMMSSQLDWTQSLGVAFLNQQSDVMNAIQELRQAAETSGALQSTPQQDVVTDDDGIEIVPVDPNVVYVPEYDPDAVFWGEDGGVLLTFGTGYPEGIWLNNDIDWHHHWVAGGDGWNHGWNRPGGRGAPAVAPDARQWERDRAQPIPVRSPAAIAAESRGVRPGYENSKNQPPAAGAFQGYQNRAGVQRDVNRAQQRQQVPEEHPAPQAQPVPPERVQPEARPEPQERPAPPPQPEPPPAFHPDNGGAAAQQSERGHASQGGGGGGGRRR